MMNEPLPDSSDVNEQGFNMPNNTARERGRSLSTVGGTGGGAGAQLPLFPKSSVSE